MNSKEKAWDPVWEKIFSGRDWGKYPGESLIRFIASNFYKSERESIKILEVGCGTGANIWFMSREQFDVFGIDGSETAIKKALEALAKEDLQATLRVGDIVNLPYGDNFFDAVVDVECLYCNNEEDSQSILSEIKRVLKPSGLFYSRTFSDTMYTGKQFTSAGRLQYNHISDGPLEGKGFVRLIDRPGIEKLYGAQFKIISTDKLESTYNNNQFVTSEWIIISQKE